MYVCLSVCVSQDVYPRSPIHPAGEKPNSPLAYPSPLPPFPMPISRISNTKKAQPCTVHMPAMPPSTIPQTRVHPPPPAAAQKWRDV